MLFAPDVFMLTVDKYAVPGRVMYFTLVAKNKATPTMLDSLIMVSLGLISTGPLQPTILKKEQHAINITALVLIMC